MQRGSARSAFRWPMNASRVAASLTWLNSSSNWSTTRSSFCAGGSAASVAVIAAAGSSSAPASVRASSSIGVAPGRIVSTRQVPRGKFLGSSSFGSSPAVTSDDLPEPDEPITTRKWCWRIERHELLDLVVAAVEEAGVLLAERDHAGIGAGDGLDRRLGGVEVAAEPGGLVVPAGPVGAVERLAEAEPQGGLAGVQGQGQQAVATLVDGGERDEPLAELGPAVGQERRAEHEQGEAARGHATLELGRDALAQTEVARGEHASRVQAQRRLEVAVDPGAVGLGMDDEEVVRRRRWGAIRWTAADVERPSATFTEGETVSSHADVLLLAVTER